MKRHWAGTWFSEGQTLRGGLESQFIRICISWGDRNEAKWPIIHTLWTHLTAQLRNQRQNHLSLQLQLYLLIFARPLPFIPHSKPSLNKEHTSPSSHETTADLPFFFCNFDHSHRNGWIGCLLLLLLLLLLLVFFLFFLTVSSPSLSCSVSAVKMNPVSEAHLSSAVVILKWGVWHQQQRERGGEAFTG